VALNTQLAFNTCDVANNAIAPLLNSGKLRIYDGAQPANADTAVTTQNLLAELTFNASAFGASASGVITANAITAATIAITGTATWCRLVKSDGTTVVMDGTVGTSGTNVVVGSVAFQAGAQAAITSCTFTTPRQGA